MGMETVFVRETLATVHADVGPLARVHPRVGSQVVFQEKRFATLCARVGPLLGYSRFLLLLGFGIYLACIYMSENVAKVRTGFGLTGGDVVGLA